MEGEREGEGEWESEGEMGERDGTERDRGMMGPKTPEI